MQVGVGWSSRIPQKMWISSYTAAQRNWQNIFALIDPLDSPTDWVAQASFPGDRRLISRKMKIFIYRQAAKITDYVWHLQLRKAVRPIKWDNQSFREVEF